MGFFKDFKDDLSEVTGDIPEDELEQDSADGYGAIQSDIEAIQRKMDENQQVDELVEDTSYEDEEVDTDVSEMTEEDEEEDVDDDDDGVTPIDETAVITSGLNVTGNFDALGSIDVFGKITGDIKCRGKLTVGGTVIGASQAGEVFANDARIEGDVVARGAVKIGQNTVIIGNISGTSAVIAGAVKGNIDVRGPVIIDSTAIVSGDIMSKTVQINNGATIDGRCTQCYSDIDLDAVFHMN